MDSQVLRNTHMMAARPRYAGDRLMPKRRRRGSVESAIWRAVRFGES